VDHGGTPLGVFINSRVVCYTPSIHIWVSPKGPPPKGSLPPMAAGDQGDQRDQGVLTPIAEEGR